MLAVSYDITDRKRIEDERKHTEIALRESEARLQAIANLVPDLLIFCLMCLSDSVKLKEHSQ